jgi:hypothetical protein
VSRFRNFLLLFPQGIVDLSRKNKFKAESLHTQGTLQDLLDCHKDGLKIINGLDFLMASAPHPLTAFASDLAAFIATIDLPFCGRDIGFPVMSCRWGLAAVAGASHLWHIDCNGFGTYIDTQAGFKWWVMARPKHPSDFSSTSLFTEQVTLDGPNESVWILEAVLLGPGSCLSVFYNLCSKTTH